jgi:hypothetical protein
MYAYQSSFIISGLVSVQKFERQKFQSCYTLSFKSFFVCLSFAVVGFELRAFTLSHSFFVMGVFEIGSHELFARAAFEL